MKSLTDTEIEALLDALAPIPALYPAGEFVANARPSPESLAALDATLPLGSLPMLYAVQNLQVAIDHLLTWNSLFVSARHLPSFAHMTLLRSAIEAAAKARWLVDPKADPALRIARGALCQMESNVEERKFIQLDSGNEMLPDVIQREVTLQASRDEHGYGKGVRTNATAISNSHGLGEWSWRFTSGYAHGLDWAISVGGTELESHGVPDGQRRINAAVPTGIAVNLTQVTVGLVTNAHNEVLVYAGGPFPIDAD